MMVSTMWLSIMVGFITYNGVVNDLLSHDHLDVQGLGYRLLDGFYSLVDAVDFFSGFAKTLQLIPTIGKKIYEFIKPPFLASPLWRSFLFRCGSSCDL